MVRSKSIPISSALRAPGQWQGAQPLEVEGGRGQPRQPRGSERLQQRRQIHFHGRIHHPQRILQMAGGPRQGEIHPWPARRQQGPHRTAQIGPVEVRITLDRDVATIALAAAQGPVREALQASLPRLAEALASSGLQLGQASVGSESFLGRGGQERGPGSGAQDAPTLASSLSGPEVPAALLRMQPLGAALARGGIDLFA